MNKGDFIKLAAEKAGFSQKDATIAYNAFLDVLTDALKEGDKVQLAGFATFELKEVAAKKGVNPATGEEVDIAACKKPVMKFGKAYKDSFNA
jgi:DNA-binding protein HU-beta